jgi:very-short-patch-repair endonuclease
MKVEVALQRLGGVADARSLKRLTSRAKIRVALARGRIVRDVRGRYALPGTDEAVRAANRLSGVLCLDSAARHHGWKVKQVPTTPAVAVPRKRKVTPDRRAGVRLIYVDLSLDEIAGIATSPVRTVMDCASRLPFDESLSIADSALRAADVTKAELLAAAEKMPERYRGRCLRVVRAADGRAENPFESVLRAIALDIPGLHVEPQVWIDPVGRPDLVDRELRLVIEADSFEFHGKRWFLTRDCERYNSFVVRGWLVIRFSWEHVMFEPEYVARVLRTMVELLSRGPLRPALEAGEERLSA